MTALRTHSFTASSATATNPSRNRARGGSSTASAATAKPQVSLDAEKPGGDEAGGMPVA